MSKSCAGLVEPHRWLGMLLPPQAMSTVAACNRLIRFVISSSTFTKGSRRLVKAKGIPSAPPSSSSSSTGISQAWQLSSLVERFQAQLNCAPLPMSLHDKYATKILLNGAARNQTNRDGVNKEENTNTVKTDRDGEDHKFISLPSGTRNT